MAFPSTTPKPGAPQPSKDNQDKKPGGQPGKPYTPKSDDAHNAGK